VNNNSILFYKTVTQLEEVLNSTSNPLELIRLIDENEFLALRESVLEVFEADIKYDKKFGNEVEFGDISDAVRATTFEMFPLGCEEVENDIVETERKKAWVEKIITNMDHASTFSG
jgi:predicted transcriptional regulator